MMSAVLMTGTVPFVPLQTNAAGNQYEFEKGSITDKGENKAELVSVKGASGGKAVDLKDGGNSVSVNVDAESGMNRITFRYYQPYDEDGKYQNIIVNGKNIGEIFCEYTGDGQFKTVSVNANLKQGKNDITVEASWGWTYFDCMLIEKGEFSSYTGGGKLSNPKASAQAQSLYNFLCDTYGNHVISGQQESTWMGSEDYEFDIIKNASGKYPALRGLDYMGDDFAGCNRRAKKWYDKGGIVTICWHCGSDFSGSHTESLASDLNWNAALTEGTAEYNALIAGMDKGAKALKELQEQGIPVVWRPFHEFDGKWFWWGKGGAENFKKLWRIMYDRYTNYWGLDNLIWSLGYCGDVNGGWYPGDQYVDIIGADTYVDHTDSLSSMYNKTAQVAKKPVCLHENGPIPDPEKMKNDGAKWLWFMTWHTSFIDSSPFNTASYLKRIYNSDYMLTLDELPDVYHYGSNASFSDSEPVFNIAAAEAVKGDINGDGEVNVADAVILQKYLLGYKNIEMKDWKTADICEDSRLDVFDMIGMRKLLSTPSAPTITEPSTPVVTPNTEHSSAKVSIAGTKFMVNGKELWINGVNTPWQNWNDFEGRMDEAFWDKEFARLEADNINCTRIWVNCNGEGVVQLDDSGKIKSINQGHWNDLDKLFKIAEKHHVYVMPTILSFDHFKSENTGAGRWQKMISNKASADDFAEKYVAEFARRYDKCDYILGVDLMNEPDWVNENPECGNIDWSHLSYFFGKCAAAIHENSSLYVTVGIGIIKYNSDKYEGNKVSDQYMQQLTGNKKAYLDFYSTHYYNWQKEWYGYCWDKSPKDFGLDGTKPSVIGETHNDDSGDIGISLSDKYRSVYDNGWNGIMVWMQSGNSDPVWYRYDLTKEAANSIAAYIPDKIHPDKTSGSSSSGTSQSQNNDTPSQPPVQVSTAKRTSYPDNDFQWVNTDYLNNSWAPQGKVERFWYDTRDNAGGGSQTYKKSALVYVPAGYDSSKKYNVLYLMHGGSDSPEWFFGGEGKSSNITRMMDSMIAAGDIEPLIVCAVSYYTEYRSDDTSNCLNFHHELMKDVIPAFEKKYSTYANGDTSSSSLAASRLHRGFAGFSMGSVTTWSVFEHCLNEIAYYMPISGDCWALGGTAGGSQPDQTAWHLASKVKEAGKSAKDFYIYSGCGEWDIAQPNLTPQITSMKNMGDPFIYTNNFANGNLFQCLYPGGGHDVNTVTAVMYNGLPKLFG